MDALAAANHGHAIAYGDDVWTGRLRESLRTIFGARVEALPVWGGTGANIVGLASVVTASDAIVCADSAHIHVDEAGAPERMAGVKLLPVPTVDGKLRPEDVEGFLGWL